MPHSHPHSPGCAPLFRGRWNNAIFPAPAIRRGGDRIRPPRRRHLVTLSPFDKLRAGSCHLVILIPLSFLAHPAFAADGTPPKPEEAVDRGLAFLARQQRPDGSISDLKPGAPAGQGAPEYRV